MPRKHARDPKTPRRQFAALPCMSDDSGTRIMLVTSRGTGRWVLPKGWPKKRHSGAAIAALEAFEEAGVEGEVAPASIGFYRYPKRMAKGRVVECDVDVYAMRVARLLDDWPERTERERRWFTLSEAADAVKEADLTALLLRLAGQDAAS